jgi:hypothetical protein
MHTWLHQDRKPYSRSTDHFPTFYGAERLIAVVSTASHTLSYQISSRFTFMHGRCPILQIESVAWSAQRIATAVNMVFLDRSRYYSIQVAPQLSSRGWVGPVPDPLLLRKSASAGNRTRDLWICSQELWPLDYGGGPGFFSDVPPN